MEVEGSVGEIVSTASVALKADRYRPRIYGFQLNETAKLQRWQEAVRDRYVSFYLRTTRKIDVVTQTGCEA